MTGVCARVEGFLEEGVENQGMEAAGEHPPQGQQMEWKSTGGSGSTQQGQRLRAPPHTASAATSPLAQASSGPQSGRRWGERGRGLVWGSWEAGGGKANSLGPEAERRGSHSGPDWQP